MQYRPLGRTDMQVSAIGLGTMTFGEQNTEAEAFAQLDASLDAGVNLIDVAEMYPIPPRAETAGRTEETVGRWMRARGTRSRVVLATKITGPGANFAHVRGGDLRHGRSQIRAAVEGSLRRLGVDHIDLYQIHWPDRRTNYFGERGYVHDPEVAGTPFAETLDALTEEVRAGRLRAVGVSNETPWGLTSFLSLADNDGLPRMASIQNPYSLLNRLFEVGTAEVSMREDCGLLAYSPMAFGTLSGKYLNDARPPGSRLTLFPHYGRYTKPNAVAATEAYVNLAREHGLDPAQMAIAWVVSRPFVTSALIGATKPDQLAADLGAADLHLPSSLLDAIDAIHDDNPSPAP